MVAATATFAFCSAGACCVKGLSACFSGNFVTTVSGADVVAIGFLSTDLLAVTDFVSVVAATCCKGFADFFSTTATSLSTIGLVPLFGMIINF